MNKQLIVFIESNTSGTGEIFATTAMAMGYDPLLLCRDPSKYPYISKHNLNVRECDTSDSKKIVEVLEEFEHTEIAGITSSSEYFIATAASLAEVFALPGPKPAAVTVCRNKIQQRLHLHKAKLNRTNFEASRSAEDAKAAAKIIGLPVVLKPVSGSGSCGVKLCNTYADIAVHARALFQENSIILVEQYIKGTEYSVEMFSGEVIGITAKRLGEPPYFVETGHTFPAPISQMQTDRLAKFAVKIAETFDLMWGPVHIELKHDGDHVHLVEVNPRLAGGFIPELIKVAKGIDLIKATVSLVVGKKPELKSDRANTASINFVIPYGEGRVTDIRGIDQARALPGVADVKFYKKIAFYIERHGDFKDRIGHVLARAEQPSQAEYITNKAAALIKLEIQNCKDCLAEQSLFKLKEEA